MSPEPAVTTALDGHLLQETAQTIGRLTLDNLHAGLLLDAAARREQALNEALVEAQRALHHEQQLRQQVQAERDRYLERVRELDPPPETTGRTPPLGRPGSLTNPLSTPPHPAARGREPVTGGAP